MHASVLYACVSQQQPHTCACLCIRLCDNMRGRTDATRSHGELVVIRAECARCSCRVAVARCLSAGWMHTGHCCSSASRVCVCACTRVRACERAFRRRLIFIINVCVRRLMYNQSVRERIRWGVCWCVRRSSSGERVNVIIVRLGLRCRGAVIITRFVLCVRACVHACVCRCAIGPAGEADQRRRRSMRERARTQEGIHYIAGFTD